MAVVSVSEDVEATVLTVADSALADAVAVVEVKVLSAFAAI